MRLASLASILFAVAALTGCRSASPGPEVASAALSAAEATHFVGPEAENACAESLSAFTAADVRARRDAHAVVARVEPGVVARREHLGLHCEATLTVTWREAGGDEESELEERVRVVARRQPGGEVAVLVHENVPEEHAAVDDATD